MGDKNQLIFIKQKAKVLEGPYLEIGSRDYGSTQDLRSLFSNRGKYVGIDLTAGKGVDVILDLTGDFEDIDRVLNHERFGTIFCLSVLEHCDQPFKMAENLSRLLKRKGVICISAPFAWKFHGYPSDYWRFTHEGIKKLFPMISFDSYKGISVAGETIFPLDENIGKISFTSKAHWSKGHFLRGITAKSIQLLSKVGILRWLGGYRYVMAPTHILLAGVLKEDRQ
jgi:SAM-dependent methyltransferase